MILNQDEVMKVLAKDAKTMSTRQIAKKYKIAHHANVGNWLHKRKISVQMLEHLTKEITKNKKRKAKGN